jgi:exosortase A-associated hydrolase 2
MTEIPYFFGSSPQLFGVFHGSDAAQRLPFVFCHPFGEEKLWGQRVYVTFARALAQRGHPVLRFDLAGNGDSEGEFVDSSLTSATRDLDLAIADLKQRTGADGIGLLGLRLGASLAIRQAAARDDIRRVVAWSPIVKGGPYLQELLRINVTTQMAVYREVREDRTELGRRLADGGSVNIDGYEIGGALARDLDRLSLLDAPGPSAPTLVVSIDRAPQPRPVPDLERLVSHLPAATFAAVQEEPFWKEIPRFYDTAPALYAATLGWLDAQG